MRNVPINSGVVNIEIPVINLNAIDIVRTNKFIMTQKLTVNRRLYNLLYMRILNDSDIQPDTLMHYATSLLTRYIVNDRVIT